MDATPIRLGPGKKVDYKQFAGLQAWTTVKCGGGWSRAHDDEVLWKSMRAKWPVALTTMLLRTLRYAEFVEQSVSKLQEQHRGRFNTCHMEGQGFLSGDEERQLNEVNSKGVRVA